MTKRLLTKKEQEQLKRNPNVQAVSEKRSRIQMNLNVIYCRK